MNGGSADGVGAELRRDLPALATYAVAFFALYWALVLASEPLWDLLALAPGLVVLALYAYELVRIGSSDASAGAALGSFAVQWIVVFPLATLGLNVLGMKALSAAMGSEWTFYYAIGVIANVFYTSALCAILGVAGVVVLALVK